MSENGKKKCLSLFSKAQDDVLFFCPQPKDNQFTVIKEERNQEIFTFKKLESEIFYFFM